MKSTLQLERKKFGIGSDIVLEDVSYPLTHIIEKRRTQEVKTRFEMRPAKIFTILLNGDMGINRYEWDKVRNRNYYEGGSQINLTLGPARISYREQFTREHLMVYSNGIALRRYRILSTGFSQSTKSTELSFTTEVSLEFYEPPVALSFNSRDKRLIRSTMMFTKNFGDFKTRINLLFRTEDEVFMDPTRSSYTRREEFYRIDGMVGGNVWSNRSTIASIYSKFRFLPSRNLLIRYLEDEIKINLKNLRIYSLFHIQDNGQYLPGAGNQYLFHVEKKVNEFRLNVRVPAVLFKFWGIYFEVSRYLRWEKRGSGSFNLSQSERGIGLFLSYPSAGSLLIKWVDRLSEKQGLYISTRFVLTI